MATDSTEPPIEEPPPEPRDVVPAGRAGDAPRGSGSRGDAASREGPTRGLSAIQTAREARKKRKKNGDDDDEDDDEDGNRDDEDERPKAKLKKKRQLDDDEEEDNAKKKRRPIDADDED